VFLSKATSAVAIAEKALGNTLIKGGV
jgi:hypothetical protein